MEDEIALTALQNGWLNLHAYALSIKPKIDSLTWKEVKVGSIVVALSRLAEKVKSSAPVRPKIVLDDVSLKLPLCDITFERTLATLEKARDMAVNLEYTNNQFLTITQSSNEITLIASEDKLDLIQQHFGVAPKAVFTNLVALTVRFPLSYLEVPNFIFAVLGILAQKHINIIEIVSTLTELSMIINNEDMTKAVTALQKYLGKSRLTSQSLQSSTQ